LSVIAPTLVEQAAAGEAKFLPRGVYKQRETTRVILENLEK